MDSIKKRKIILINNQTLFRKELKICLENRLDSNIIEETNNWKKFRKLNAIVKSDVVHMDIILPQSNHMDAKQVITDQLIIRLSKYNRKHICLNIR